MHRCHAPQDEPKAGKVELYEQLKVEGLATGRWVPVKNEKHRTAERFVSTAMINSKDSMHTMNSILSKGPTKNQVIEYLASGADLDRIPILNRCVTPSCVCCGVQ